MSKLRSVSTAFWSDPFIEELTASEKLLYLYLITNDKTNMLGIYEVSFKKISFETGINKDLIIKAFKSFERLSKVKYIDNHVILLNFIKHQNFNTNMMKSAIDVYNALPQVLKIEGLVISKEKPLEGFQRLSKALGMVSKVEVEVEVETEEETEEESKDKKTDKIPPDFETFKVYAIENKSNIDLDALKLKYNSWIENGWKTNGKAPKKIVNWKSTLLNTLTYIKEKETKLTFDTNR